MFFPIGEPWVAAPYHFVESRAVDIVHHYIVAVKLPVVRQRRMLQPYANLILLVEGVEIQRLRPILLLKPFHKHLAALPPRAENVACRAAAAKVHGAPEIDTRQTAAPVPLTIVEKLRHTLGHDSIHESENP